MAGDDDYIYDEATGEWRPASELAAAKAEVRDASGNVLADGDSVVLIKDLKVKGAGQTLKQGTVIKAIRITDNPEEIDCRHQGSGAQDRVCSQAIIGLPPPGFFTISSPVGLYKSLISIAGCAKWVSHRLPPLLFRV